MSCELSAQATVSKRQVIYLFKILSMYRTVFHVSMFLGLITLLSVSCQTEAKQTISPVDRLYQEYELQPNAERAEVYLDSLESFLRANIDNEELIQPHLEKGVKLSMAQGMLSRTSNYILPLLRLYPNLNDRKGYLSKLGDIMYTLRKRHASSIVYSELLKAYPNDPELKKKESLLDSLSKVHDNYVKYLFDQILVNPDELGVNKAASLKYVDAVEALALVSPNDTLVPGNLYTAAEVARSMRTFPKAMSLYDWLIDTYPKHDKTPNALFIKGFILEQDYNRPEEAKELYTRFVTEFPDHDMVESAKFLLKNLGKSDKEILQEIESAKQNN